MADPDGHEYICVTCLASAARQFVSDHPIAVGVAKGLGNAALGVATVAVSLGGEAGSGELATPVAAIGASTGASLFVKGVTQAVGAAQTQMLKRPQKP
jgi:hypothetical protein